MTPNERVLWPQDTARLSQPHQIPRPDPEAWERFLVYLSGTQFP